MNKVSLSGKIVKIYEGKHITFVTIFIQHGRYKDFPTIAFFGEDRETVKNFKKNDFVAIEGSVKVRRMIDDAEHPAHPRYEQTIRGTAIEIAETRYKNNFHIEGVLVSIIDTGTFATMLIHGMEDNFQIRVVAYKRQLIDFLEQDIEDGDTVSLDCVVQTILKTNTDKVHRLTSLVIEKAQKI